MTRLPIPSEFEEQKALFEWADLVHRSLWTTRPETRGHALDMLFAVPNGGLRSKAAAGKLKAEGVKPGVPDVCLPVPSADGQAACLWIELKRLKGGRLSEAQNAWIERLSGTPGHRVQVCRGWVEAARAIAAYLDLPAEHWPEAGP